MIPNLATEPYFSFGNPTKLAVREPLPAYLKSLQGCVSIPSSRGECACCVLEGLEVLIVMFKLLVLVWVLRCVPGGFVFWQRSANLFIHGHYD